MSVNSANERRSAPSKSGCFSIQRELIEDDCPFDSVEELTEAFGGESACASFLEELRFPRGFICPRCECRERPWRTGMGLLACPGCRQPWALTEGTPFHGSRIPLTRWFAALWSWLEREDGLDPASFGALLGMDDEAQAGVYQAQLRAFMGADEQRLRGEVRLAMAKIQLSPDEDRVTPVIMALEHQACGAPRVRLRLLNKTSASAVMRFAADVIARGSLVVTPPWKGLSNLTAIGFLHTMRASQIDGAHRLDPSQVWSLARLWLWSQPARRVAADSLLDELAFRFNHRHMGTGAAWITLMKRLVGAESAARDVLEAVG
ncbi:MAG: IS1595 family transposase [Polyangiaceae bacterium]